MIYSRWLPTGGYEYYESERAKFNLGDDLPDPIIPAGNEIGTAAQEVGRPLPADAVLVGSGPDPVGLMTPAQSTGLGTVSEKQEGTLVPYILVACAAGVIGFVIGRAMK
jgi:hypothetical protein